MSLWAGYYVRDPRRPPSPRLAGELARGLSRRSDAVVESERFDRALLVFAESSAFDGSSARRGEGAFTLMAGEPLLARSQMGGDRASDITRLHESWAREDFSICANASGTFAAVHYDARTASLSLIADRLGVRPIYFAITDDLVVFANAMRVLEAVPSLPKVVDVRGAVEALGIGHPLADRTTYRDVFAIRDGEVVTFRDRDVRRRYYWRITSVAEERASLDELAARTHSAFATAVDQRLRSDRRVVAFLSGGLDSRCVVAELRARGVEVHTFNFANEGTKDQVLGDAFARAAGTIHLRSPRPPDPVHWSVTMAERWGASPHRATHPVERPGTAWSGDGGSVGYGFVSVYPNVLALLRRGRRDEAAEVYCRERELAVPLRLFRRRVASELRDVLRIGVREAFDEARSDGEPGRDLWFFRLQHGQRRHLALHFEDMDLHRLELQLPFHDADFIAAVAAAPTDYGVGHRLYNAALPLFPSVVSAVPWQTYPGHEPCPIPMPPDAIDQWGERQKDIARRERRAGILREAAHLLGSASFPAPLIKRARVGTAGIVHWLGGGDYAYVMDIASNLSALWRVSEGRWQLDPISRDAREERPVALDVQTANQS